MNITNKGLVRFVKSLQPVPKFRCVNTYLGGPAETAGLTVLSLVRTRYTDRHGYHDASTPCNPQTAGCMTRTVNQKHETLVLSRSLSDFVS